MGATQIVPADPAQGRLAGALVDDLVLQIEAHGAERAAELWGKGCADRRLAAVHLAIPGAVLRILGKRRLPSDSPKDT